MAFHKHILVYFLMSFLVLSCGKGDDGDSSSIKITIPAQSEYEKTQFLALANTKNTTSSTNTETSSSDTTAPYAPADVKGFDCIFVNVIGSGIGDWDTNKNSVGSDKKISYIGTYSKLVPVQTGGTVEVKVMKGADRIIQLVGVKSKVGCPDSINKDDLASTDKFPGLFIVGSVEKEVSKAEEVEITSTYTQKSASDFRGTKDKPWPAADKTPPTPGGNGDITGNSTANSITVTWKEATDDGSPQNQLSYKLLSAKAFSDLKTITDAEKKGAVLMDWTRKVTSKTITGLSTNTLINFGLLVKDVSENKAMYKPEWVTTLSVLPSTGTQNVKIYSITYDSNGATGGKSPVDIKSYPTGTNVRILSNTGALVKTGYDFAGWNTLANGTGTDYAENSPFVMGSADVVIYAKWTPVPPAPTYTVTYNDNGSTGGSVPADSQTYASGASVTVLTNSGLLVKTGFVFSGWNTLTDGSGTDYAPNAPLTMASANIVLYAKWIAAAPSTYTMTYDANGATAGSVPSDNSTYLDGAAVSVLGNTGSLVRTGYNFVGWNTSVNGTGTDYAAGSSTYTMGASNAILYAKWTPLTYTITYDSNGSSSGTVPIDNNSYINGASATVLGNTGTLTKTGYTFSGWNTLANGTGTDYLPSASYTMGSSNVTLYAKWTAATYVLSYNANGATGGSVPSDSIYTAGDTATVSNNTGFLVKTNSMFVGWNTDPSGTGTSYAVNDTFTINADTTLYAVWSSFTFYVSNTGSDTSGLGTANSPYASLDKALTVAKSSPLTGQFTINVAGGTYPVNSRLDLYSDNKSFAFYGGYNSSFSSRDITANETIISDTRVGTNNKEIFYFLGTGINTPFVIEGFTINCGAAQGSPTATSYNPIYFSGGKTVTVSKNKINIDYAYSSTAIAYNMYPNSTESNQVWKFTNNLVTMRNSSGNTTIMKGVDTPNYYSETNLTVQMYNNVFYAPDRGTTPSNNNNLVSFSLTTGGNNFYIRNNTFIFKGASGDDEYKSALFFGNSVSMVSLENNIFYSLSGLGAAIGVDSGDFAALNNNSMYFSGQTDTSNVLLKITAQIVTVTNMSQFNGRPNSSSNQYSDPSFVNIDSDWDLQNSSPVKGAGEDGSSLGWEFSTDINDNTRTGNGTTGWSIGAYEKD